MTIEQRITELEQRVAELEKKAAAATAAFDEEIQATINRHLDDLYQRLAVSFASDTL